MTEFDVKFSDRDNYGCIYCFKPLPPPEKGIAKLLYNTENALQLGLIVLCEKCFETYELSNFTFHWKKKEAI